MIVHRWVPGVPQWAWALILMVVLTLTNVVSVEVLRRVRVLVRLASRSSPSSSFIVLGIAAIFGLLPGDRGAGPGQPHRPRRLLPQRRRRHPRRRPRRRLLLHRRARSSPSPPGSPPTRVGAVDEGRQLDVSGGSCSSTSARSRSWSPCCRGTTPRSPRARTSPSWSSIGIPRRRRHHGRHRAHLGAVLPQLRPLHRHPDDLLARAAAATPRARRTTVSRRGVPRSAVLASTVVGFVTVGLNYLAPGHGVPLPRSTPPARSRCSSGWSSRCPS